MHRGDVMALTEIIVKYNGDIFSVANAFNSFAEILSPNYAILFIDSSQINQLYSFPEIEDIELPKKLYLGTSFNLTSSCIRTVQNPYSYNLNGNGTIIGIVDSGIDYTHIDFRNADGSTRILYLWDQTVEGSPPANFNEGTEYTQFQINSALQSDNPFSVVPSNDFNGHGTAVAGIAAGNGNSSDGENIGVAFQADLIIVKVGQKGNDFFAQTTEIMRAVKYIISKSRELQKPVAINMSFGMNNGSHKGSSLFEEYLSEISAEWKNVLVVPTGNEGGAAHHFNGSLKSNQVKEIEFFTASGITNFYLSLWKNFADSFAVELIFPNGISSGVVNLENRLKTVRVDNMTLTVIYGQPTRYSAEQEIYFNISANENYIRSGLWKLRIIPSTIVDGEINIWLPTVEEVTAKTYFSNPSVYNTMTLPSTANKVIRVSGYNDRIGNIAEFSGNGIPDTSLIPDIAAPAVNIVSARSGGGYDYFTGTSFAAPFVTGSAALMMQWGIVNGNSPFLYGERIKAFLRLGARRSDGVVYPNQTFGYGTLCLSNSVSYMERYQWGGFEFV